MKTLNITFTDTEYKKLLKAKNAMQDNRSWHRFFLSCAIAPRVLK